MWTCAEVHIDTWVSATRSISDPPCYYGRHVPVKVTLILVIIERIHVGLLMNSAAMDAALSAVPGTASGLANKSKTVLVY